MSNISTERKSKALMVAFTAIWAKWDDSVSDASDDALRLLCELARSSEAHALALDYFVAVYLDDVNPQDLTYCEMMAAMQVEVTG